MNTQGSCIVATFNYHFKPTPSLPLITFAFSLLLLLLCNPSVAVGCDRYKQRLERYEELRHLGGKAAQMAKWQLAINQLEDKLRECRRAGSIQIVSGATSYRSAKSSRKPREHQSHLQRSVVAPSSPVTDASRVRKLKDCIKPNNVIDNDVNECMKGNVMPDWKN